MKEDTPILIPKTHKDIGDGNKRQKEIAQLYLEPGAPQVLRVIAGPGTGKTTLVSLLLKKMFLEATKPLYPNFLVLTFTKRTRFDLVRKIYKLAGYDSKKRYMYNRVRNFHSFAWEVVRWKKILRD